ncbi:MAG: DNA-processing protein DprA [Bifidobacteriaceae bacterium]|jgi:DNA processing protein|nr:DNA-processing protein DprA [Bifidobacteriaceae bacterium]
MNDSEAALTLSIISDPGNEVINHLLDQMGYVEVIQYLEGLLAGSYSDQMQLTFNYFYTNFQAGVRKRPKADSYEIMASNLARVAINYRSRKIERALKLHDKNEIITILRTDPQYPKQFHDLEAKKPLVIFARGQLSLLEKSQIVGIVGTRHFDNYGQTVAIEFARTLTQSGIVIVSGGAIGVDSAAHLGSLGNSIVVLASGLDKMYPKECETIMLKNLEQGGLCLSEMPATSIVKGHLFLLRNRLIAALSKAVVIVEASYRSGAINTAQHAFDLHRLVCAIPGDVDQSRSSGTNRLIMDHKAEMVTTAQELLGLMNLEIALELSPEQPKIYQPLGIDLKELPELERDTIMAMDFKNENALESIRQTTQLPLKELLLQLSRLEQKGIITKTEVGYKVLH